MCRAFTSPTAIHVDGTAMDQFQSPSSAFDSYSNRNHHQRLNHQVSRRSLAARPIGGTRSILFHLAFLALVVFCSSSSVFGGFWYTKTSPVASAKELLQRMNEESMALLEKMDAVEALDDELRRSEEYNDALIENINKRNAEVKKVLGRLGSKKDPYQQAIQQGSNQLSDSLGQI